MNIKSRVIWAFLIAPVSFGLLLFVLSLFQSSPGVGFWGVMMSALIGYPIAIIFGIPLYYLLSKLGANGFITYGIMSLVFSALPIAYFIVRPIYLANDGDLSTLFLEARLLQMSVLVFASFLTVSVFWLIARPDKPVPTV